MNAAAAKSNQMYETDKESVGKIRSRSISLKKLKEKYQKVQALANPPVVQSGESRAKQQEDDRAEMANQYLSRQDFIRRPHKYNKDQFDGSGSKKNNTDIVHMMSLPKAPSVIVKAKPKSPKRRNNIKKLESQGVNGSTMAQNPFSPTQTFQSQPQIEINDEIRSLQTNVENCLSELTSKMQDIEDKVKVTQNNMDHIQVNNMKNLSLSRKK